MALPKFSIFLVLTFQLISVSVSDNLAHCTNPTQSPHFIFSSSVSDNLGFCAKPTKPPHIIFFLIDDLGWNDISFHGSNQIPTPNIDALAYSGIILNNYYLQPICTPSRGALMTGLHPIHTGLQTFVILGNSPWGLPLDIKLLPEHLNDLGYESRLVGKWHLGFFKKEYTPTYRGFKEFYGFLNSHIDYYDHTTMYYPNDWGYDFWRNTELDRTSFGKYLTDLISDEGIKIVNNHNSSQPLFLYMSHGATHFGSPLNRITAPIRNAEKFPYIEMADRKKFAGCLDRLDETIGDMVEALSKNDMLENSIIIFSTDNGGPAAGYDFSYASNWPLRGTKGSMWEGGMRGAGFIWSPLLQKTSRVSTQLMSVMDWLPTLIEAAGGDSDSLEQEIEGKSMWQSLSKDRPSPREELLHNIDPVMTGASLRDGDWKIVTTPQSGGPEFDGWLLPSGRVEVDREMEENIDLYYEKILTSKTAKAIKNIMPNGLENMKQMRKTAEILCDEPPADASTCYNNSSPCLFNVANDPCEYRDLSDQYPQIMEVMLARLEAYNATAVTPSILPDNPKADPVYWDATWTTYGDFREQIITED